LTEIRSLRSQGLITPQEAYERHMAALGPAIEAQPAIGPIDGVTTLNTPAQPTAEPGRSRAALDVIAITLALVGGVLGIGGAIIQELQADGFLAAFIAAPIIEEGMKPAGIYILLTRWPQAARSQLHVASLTALSGVCFGLIESLVYVTLYFPEQGNDYVLFRFTIPVAMHAVASFVVGLGLSRAVIDWAAGRQRLPKPARNFYLAGVGLHAVYNTLAVILGIAGVFAFE
jgi:RsiW-degrading membrane proteinase PrsW (M82 family)